MDLQIALKHLGEQLGPTEYSKSFGRQKVDEVFQIVKTYSSLSYDRFRFVGGAEQKTSCIAKMDFDCVAYVNVDESWWNFQNTNSDFVEKLDRLRKEVMADWQKFLPAKMGSKVEVLFLGYLCTLEWKDLGLKVDLLVAPNALNNDRGLRSDNTQPGDLQVINMFKALSNSVHALKGKKKKKKMKQISQNFTFSVSVMERSVEVMEKRDATNHEVARLAKFWMLICCPEERRVQGLSTLISLIATRNSHQTKTIEDGFKQFLHSIINWKQLHVDDTLKWLQTSDDQKKQAKVMDPGNVFNNVLMENCGMRAKFLSTFNGQARLSLRRIAAQSGASGWFEIADVLLADRARRYHRGHVPKKTLHISLHEKGSSPCLYPRIESSKWDNSLAKINLLLASIAMSFVPRYDSGRERSYAEFSADFGKILTKVLKCAIVKAVPQVEMEFEMPYIKQSAILVKCYYR